MNSLGHSYVTYKVTKRTNPWLVAGSLLPDIVPYVVHEQELFEPLHEGGLKMLTYLSKTAPEKRDLALGIIAHGVKFGVDKHNRNIDQWLLENNENLAWEIAQKIIDCSGVSSKVSDAQLSLGGI